MVVEAACDSKTFVGRNKALRAQASKAFPASAAILCRKRHHALRLDGLIPAYGTVDRRFEPDCHTRAL